MKYKTKIIPENGKYVGYVMLNEEVVYTSNPLGDPIAVSRELTAYMTTAAKPLATPVVRVTRASNSPNTEHNLVPLIRSNTQPPAPTPSITTPEPDLSNSYQAPPNPANTVVHRKCCGRG